MSVRILFMGTPDFAVPILHALIQVGPMQGYRIVGVVTQPDRPKGRKKVLTPPPVKMAAEAHHLPVLQPEKLKTPQAIREVLAFEPDLIVTAAYGQLVPEDILQAPRFGCVNVHASLLPKYRGGAPMHWAIMRGEKETGITLMYMVKTLDAGDIIRQRSTPIFPSDTMGTLHDRLKQLGAELLVETLPDLLAGRIEPAPQDEALASYAPNIRREDEAIRWDRPARDIYNQVRGLHPWPVAYTRLMGKVWKIWWGQTVQLSHHAQPGSVMKADEKGILVACSEDAFLIQDIQPEGKKRMLVKDYLRGQRLPQGVVFQSAP